MKLVIITILYIQKTLKIGVKYELIADSFNLQYHDPFLEAEKCDNVRTQLISEGKIKYLIDKIYDKN